MLAFLSFLPRAREAIYRRICFGKFWPSRRSGAKSIAPTAKIWRTGFAGARSILIGPLKPAHPVMPSAIDNGLKERAD